MEIFTVTETVVNSEFVTPDSKITFIMNTELCKNCTTFKYSLETL